MEDTQWIDVLVEKGIIKKNKKEEEEIPFLIEEKKKDVTQLNSDDEDGMDEEDEIVFLEYRRKRMEEMKIEAMKRKFGEVIEIGRQDYVKEVNNAGSDIWVVVHIYEPGVTLCSLINHYLTSLASKFPKTKFVKSISSLCLEKFPHSHLPALFIYFEGKVKKQIIGPDSFDGLNLTCEGLEWMLNRIGAIESELESDPRIQKIKSNKCSLIIEDSNDNEV